MYTQEKFDELMAWVFDHTESWYDYYNALRNCGFSYRDVVEAQEEYGWGCTEEEQREIEDALSDVFNYV